VRISVLIFNLAHTHSIRCVTQSVMMFK